MVFKELIEFKVDINPINIFEKLFQQTPLHIIKQHTEIGTAFGKLFLIVLEVIPIQLFNWFKESSALHFRV